MRQRDFHKLAMLRKEARGYTTYIPSKKCYRRKIKHKKQSCHSEYDRS